MRFAHEVAQSIQASDSLSQVLLEVALPWDACLAHWHAMQDSLEAAPIPEEQLLDALPIIRAELGNCREQRRQAMREVLPKEKALAFDRLSQPDRPNVMHFGLHNRLECVVCKPQSSEAP